MDFFYPEITTDISRRHGYWLPSKGRRGNERKNPTMSLPRTEGALLIGRDARITHKYIHGLQEAISTPEGGS